MGLRLLIESAVLADAVRPGDDRHVLRNGESLHQRRNCAFLNQLGRVRGLEELRRARAVVVLEYPDLARHLLLGGFPNVRAAERAVGDCVTQDHARCRYHCHCLGRGPGSGSGRGRRSGRGCRLCRSGRRLCGRGSRSRRGCWSSRGRLCGRLCGCRSGSCSAVAIVIAAATCH